MPGLFEGRDGAGHPLDTFARLGARLLLQQAVEEEVTAALGRGHYRHGAGRGWRNGYSPLSVTSVEGPLAVEKPKVRGVRFRSALLPRLKAGSVALGQWVTSAYVRGLSTRDLEALWAEVFGGRGLSKSRVSRLAQRLDTDFATWRRRDLSAPTIAYLFLDGTYHAVRPGTHEKEGLLAAVGITEEGQKVLLHLALGSRESYDAWLGCLHDLTARGLGRPLLVISDGAKGLLKAVSEVWPGVPGQRCLAHRMRNLLAKAPRAQLAPLKALLQQIWYAPDEATARRRAAAFAARYRRHLPSVVEGVEATLDPCLAYLRFPKEHWRTLRTTNALERPFGEVRRRTKVLGRFPSEAACLRLVFAAFVTASRTWRGVRVTPAITRAWMRLREAQEPVVHHAAA
jgi:transposase-like protein